MSLGERLKTARNNKKLTQEKAAEKLGITFQALSNYERNCRDPGTTLLSKMAELYDVTADYLLGRHEAAVSDSSTDLEIEEIFKDRNIKFNGVLLDEEDKQDMINFLKMILKRKKQ